jgi:Na+-driven multidrug efflux pump
MLMGLAEFALGNPGNAVAHIERAFELGSQEINYAGILASAYGKLGQIEQAQAAFAVSYTQLFSFITWTSVGIMGATAAVAGQNLGAGRPDRAIHGVHVAASIGLGAAATIGLAFWLMPTALLGIFGITLADDPVVLGLGVQILKYLSISGLFVTVALAYTGGLQGTGDTKSPLYISIVSQIIVPLGLCWFWQETRGLNAADIWLAIVLGHMTRALLSVARFRQGKWKNIEVSIGESSA